jgi:hypothetical protein
MEKDVFGEGLGWPSKHKRANDSDATEESSILIINVKVLASRLSTS